MQTTVSRRSDFQETEQPFNLGEKVEGFFCLFVCSSYPWVTMGMKGTYEFADVCFKLYLVFQLVICAEKVVHKKGFRRF